MNMKKYKDIPYTVIGHTTLPEKFTLFLLGDSVKKIVKEIRDGEDLRITIQNDKLAIFDIVDTHKRYPKRRRGNK